jgi:hypothetical protein
MSTELETIKHTGINRDRDLQVVLFRSDFVQLTQGLGMGLYEPGFIQLSRQDALQVIEVLKDWLYRNKP